MNAQARWTVDYLDGRERVLGERVNLPRRSRLAAAELVRQLGRRGAFCWLGGINNELEKAS